MCPSISWNSKQNITKTDEKTNKPASKQASKQANKQTNKQANKQTDKTSKQTYKPTNKQTNKQTKTSCRFVEVAFLHLFRFANPWLQSWLPPSHPLQLVWLSSRLHRLRGTSQQHVTMYFTMNHKTKKTKWIARQASKQANKQPSTQANKQASKQTSKHANKQQANKQVSK